MKTTFKDQLIKLMHRPRRLVQVHNNLNEKCEK